MEQFKREIDADPHAALFGRMERRLNPDPIGLWEKHENSISNFCRSVFGLDRHVDTQTGSNKAPAKTADTTGHVKSSGGRPEGVNNVQTKKTSSDRAVDKRNYMDARPDDLEFDPISGRMIPKRSQTQDIAGDDNGLARKPGKRPIQDDRLGYLSPIKRSDEPTVASDSAGKGVQCNEPEQQQERRMTHSGEKEAFNITDAKDQPAEPQIQQEAPSDISKTITPDEPSPVPHSKDDVQQTGNLAQIIQSGLHPDPPESTKNEGPESQNKTPKLRIQDSTKQSEPILVEDNEGLDSLRASDIRAFYVGLDQKPHTENDQALKKDVEKDSVNVDTQGIQAKPEQDHLSVDGKNTQATACTEARQPQSQDAKAPEPTRAQVQDESIGPTNTLDQTYAKPPTSSDSTKYRVLAYDSSTMQVTRADTDSTSSVNQTLHPAEVLPRLNNPARFLPYFTEMQKDGYEVVSGGGDILIFKKSDVELNKTNQPPTEAKSQDEKMNQNTEIGEQQLEQPTSASSPRLFQKPSGEPTETHAPPGENGSAFGNAIRRMAFAGTATAATCYAIGVVGGYFRTGGRDGRGIDAFTEFESERRHRD